MKQNYQESLGGSVKHSIIFRAEPGSWLTYGWIAGAPLVCLLKGGRLAVAFDWLSTKPNQGIFKCCISDDGGNKWQIAKDLSDGLVQVVDSKRPYQPTVLKDGSQIVVDVVHWVDYPESERRRFAAEKRYVYDEAQGNKAGTISILCPVWMGRSYDDGKTWSISEIKVQGSPQLNWAGSYRYGNGMLLRDGSFIKPFWESFRCALLRTEDNGQRWTSHLIASGSVRGFVYPCIVEEANGDLVAAFQPAIEQDRLWTAVSADGGKSWSKPSETRIRGGNPWLLKTNNDQLVMLYAREAIERYPEGTGIFACVSNDHGKSWNIESEFAIWDNKGEGLLSIPGGIVLADDSIFTAYVRKGNSVLGGTRFRLNA